MSRSIWEKIERRMGEGTGIGYLYDPDGRKEAREICAAQTRKEKNRKKKLKKKLKKPPTVILRRNGEIIK